MFDSLQHRALQHHARKPYELMVFEHDAATPYEFIWFSSMMLQMMFDNHDQNPYDRTVVISFMFSLF